MWILQILACGGGLAKRCRILRVTAKECSGTWMKSRSGAVCFMEGSIIEMATWAFRLLLGSKFPMRKECTRGRCWDNYAAKIMVRYRIYNHLPRAVTFFLSKGLDRLLLYNPCRSSDIYRRIVVVWLWAFFCVGEQRSGQEEVFYLYSLCGCTW